MNTAAHTLGLAVLLLSWCLSGNGQGNSVYQIKATSFNIPQYIGYPFPSSVSDHAVDTRSIIKNCDCSSLQCICEMLNDVLQVAQDTQKEKCDELSAGGQIDTLAFRLGCDPSSPLLESPPPGIYSSKQACVVCSNCSLGR